MNNEPYGSDINHHFPHTEELPRCCSENILLSGFVYNLFYFILSRFCSPTDSLPQSPTLPFSNTDLLEQIFFMSEFLISTLKSSQYLLYNKDLMSCFSMEFCLFPLFLQSAIFQISCLAMVLFISYSFLFTALVPSARPGRWEVVIIQKKKWFSDWFQVMISGAPWYLLDEKFLFNHFISRITQKNSNQEGKP